MSSEKSRQILQKIISSPSYSKILQETIITQRDGRFVVPVKADGKVIAVLDIDSDQLNMFDEVDQHFLEQMVALLTAHRAL